MFGLFKKKNPIEKLQAKYDKLMEESYKLSHTDRKQSSMKAMEAEVVLEEIEKLTAASKS